MPYPLPADEACAALPAPAPARPIEGTVVPAASEGKPSMSSTAPPSGDECTEPEYCDERALVLPLPEPDDVECP